MHISQSKHDEEGQRSGPSGQQPASRHEQVSLISEGELCLDLINSEHFDFRGRRGVQDNLTNPEWVAVFAQYWHLPVMPPPDALAMAALRALRTLLRQMFDATAAGQPVTDAQIEEINTFLALTPVMRQVQRSSNGVHLQTIVLHEGWTAVVSQIAASWVDVLERISSERLKVCANPDCHWVFIDQSHNLSRCWCRQWACGNLMKVRQFRVRARGKSEG
ncbi:MAG TPA: CGNR zinc finger domain-containing protein [Ktedonosporobacter sp.]|nr:CGNR zinc finger domain-containing protein [Ktedonosporobacter sp.]